MEIIAPNIANAVISTKPPVNGSSPKVPSGTGISKLVVDPFTITELSIMVSVINPIKLLPDIIEKRVITTIIARVIPISIITFPSLLNLNKQFLLFQ